jgi:hypothetical protein
MRRYFVSLSFFAFVLLSLDTVADSSGSRMELGRWLDDTPTISSTLVIYQQNNQYFITYIFDKGGTVTQELIKEKAKKGKESFRGVSHSGEYYIIRKDGYLEVRDSNGLIFTARPSRI